MGVKAQARESADRQRRIKIRRQGQKGSNSCSIAIPPFILREIAKMGDTNEALTFVKDNYEFTAELTKSGILFRPIKLTPTSGW